MSDVRKGVKVHLRLLLAAVVLADIPHGACPAVGVELGAEHFAKGDHLVVELVPGAHTPTHHKTRKEKSRVRGSEHEYTLLCILILCDEVQSIRLGLRLGAEHDPKGDHLVEQLVPWANTRKTKRGERKRSRGFEVQSTSIPYSVLSYCVMMCKYCMMRC